jgi:hypothetical protein
MFLGLNLLTAAGCWAWLFVKAKEFKEKVEKEGYSVRPKKRTLLQVILKLLPYIAVTLIPVLNAIFLVSFCFNDDDEMYKEVKQKMIKEGTLYKKEDNLEKEETKEEIKVEDKESDLVKEKDVENINYNNVNLWQYMSENNIPTIQVEEPDIEEDKGFTKKIKM